MRRLPPSLRRAPSASSAFVRAADGLETAGFCSTEGTEVAFANSAGQRATGRSTKAELDGIARTGTSDGAARAASARLADLDGSVAGSEATRLARDAADASDLEPGTYEVVLSPSCVVNVLGFLAIYGFNGRAVEEGRSFARARRGAVRRGASTSPTTSPTRRRWASASTPRARRSGGSSS